MIDYKIIRSKRKTIAIHITQNADIEVRCPTYVSDSFIEEFVQSKRAWIEKNTAEKKRLLKLRGSFELENGSTLYYLGRPYPVHISHVHRIDDGGIYLSGHDLKKSAELLYRRRAAVIIEEKVRHFSKIMSTSPISVKINSASTRWGSCSGKNALNFSWKLIIADERAVDYVVVHELAHTFEHNHSKRFWAIVERYMPDWRERREMLSDAQKIITAQGW